MRSYALHFASNLQHARNTSAASPRWQEYWYLSAGRSLEQAILYRNASQPTPCDIAMSLPPQTP